MKFGIIGAGRIGKIHGGNVAARPDSQVVFVSDADPAAGAALAKATGAKVAEIDAILASKDVDAVAICSPTDTHADLIERAARAKKAIFCEKPIHLDVDRVRACLDVVKRTAATLTLPPAIAARMASTIDSIAGPGRFGINLITGWQKAEYDQMGLWPGESHYKDRYNYLAEYATVLKELMETGHSDFKGQYLQMEDCRVSPKPHDVKIICAGSSDEGLAFTAQYADYSFALGKGTNTPTAFAPVNTRLAPRELRAIIDHAGPAAVLAGRGVDAGDPWDELVEQTVGLRLAANY